MKCVLPFTLCALLCMNNAWATNKTLQSEWYEIIAAYDERHGDGSHLTSSEYDKEFRDGMLDICTKIENFMKDNGLSISASAENTDFLLGSKKYDCAHVCDEVSFYYDLMMMNFACIKLLPDDKTANSGISEDKLKSLTNHCSSLYRDRLRAEIFAKYDIKKQQQTDCEELSDGPYKYRCLESGIYADSDDDDEVVTYGKCCAFNEKSQVSRHNLKIFDGEEKLSLDDFTKDCVLKE